MFVKVRGNLWSKSINSFLYLMLIPSLNLESCNGDVFKYNFLPLLVEEGDSIDSMLQFSYCWHSIVSAVANWRNKVVFFPDQKLNGKRYFCPLFKTRETLLKIRLTDDLWKRFFDVILLQNDVGKILKYLFFAFLIWEKKVITVILGKNSRFCWIC